MCNKNTRLLSLLFLSIFLLIFSACTKSDSPGDVNNQDVKIVHDSHLSDGWYLQEPIALKKSLENYLAQAKAEFSIKTDPNQIRAIIVPHAGYFYSGLCAATAYQTLLGENKELNSQINRVIVVCPSHRVFLNNIAMPNYNVYKTPLGQIEVDTQALNKLGTASTIFRTHADAHCSEHAIEIQLPFLQATIKNFKIVPLIVGSLTPDNFHEAVLTLKKIITPNTLIVISSDFTHFGENYDFKPFSKMISQQIRYIDSLAVQAIMRFSGYEFDQILKDTGATICGHMAIRLLLGLIDRGTYSNLGARLTCYYTSAQVITSKLLDFVKDQDNENSVSYAGLIFSTQKLADLKPEDQLTGFEKKSLLKQARHTIQNYYVDEVAKVPGHLLYPTVSPVLGKESGAFVTLNTKDGNLRGCIGRIFANSPLYQTVADMSIASAIQDSRFKPVAKEELDNIVIDITILTAPHKISTIDDIKLGRDGILLKKVGAKGEIITSSVFLPQVPLSFGWNLETTLQQLSLKAGMGRNDWKNNCEFEIFQGFEIKE